MTDLLIKNANLVNEGVVKQGDLLIRAGRIAQVGGEIHAPQARVIEAASKHLLPGMIDSQVHFREPGLTHKGSLSSESRAALAGGITSFFEMPNTNPQTTSCTALEDKFALAAGRAWGNYAFYLGATNDNVEELRLLRPGQTCGIKIFMGASTGNMLVDNPQTLEAIFRDAPTIVVTHCEDTPTILRNELKYKQRYGEDKLMPYHHLIRSEEACWLSSSMAADLAKQQGTRLHILHLTTEREMALFEPGPADHKQITAEACVHHLYFSADDYAERGSFIKCNPAIKTPADRAALRQALVDDKLDVIATDHAPHTLAEKQQTSYFKMPAGLPLVQYALAMALELMHDKVLTLPQVVHKTAHAPATLFKVAERGFLREGYWADLVLVDLQKTDLVKREALLYRCGWSPLEGESLRSKVVQTFVNGELKYDRGNFIGQPNGQRLAFHAAQT